jgi:MFS family permease
MPLHNDSAGRSAAASHPNPDSRPWYADVTRYQWLVLVIASLGWVFDVFEGQILVASMSKVMPSLLPQGTPSGEVAYYNNLTFGAFLLGGALGGVLFGMLSDRYGRKRMMMWTIVMYSAFTCLSAFSQTWWHLAGLRFLVAVGVGGEWAVASALLAEVFPARARAWSLAIFHASSVFGTYLATAAGYFVVADPSPESWRVGFLLGVLPALLIIWIRFSLREPEGSQKIRERDVLAGRRLGRLPDLFAADVRRRTLVGVALATVGLATFWGTHIYGKDLYRKAVERRLKTSAAAASPSGTASDPAIAKSLQQHEMIGMLLVTTGGGLGLLAFGPLCERLGRRRAFALYHIGGLAMALVMFQAAPRMQLTPSQLAACLPLFGFLTLGMHAGYAIYFPELFPTRLRGTGAGFCFNVGRVLAAPILFLGGWMQKDWGFSLEQTASILSLLFALGLALLVFAPETKGQALPE